MTKEEIRNRWIEAIIGFDWSKQKEDQKNNNNNLENEENLA